MRKLDKGRWGLRILALVLAIVIYHALKHESIRPDEHNDRTLFQHN